jgi:hypothetical protein
LVGVLYTEWTDARLTWNISEYYNLTSVVIPDVTLVWIPHIGIYNGAALLPDTSNLQLESSN